MQIEQLETNLAALKLLVSEHNEKSNDYNKQIADLEKQIIDYNKPELTPLQLDKIYETIEKVVTDFDFSDTDNYEIDYSLDYDGRVQCESHEFINGADLVQELVDKVCNLFKEADAPEEETTTDNS
jgi:hypothetical protein